MDIDHAYLDKLNESWVANPDKPEETPESTLRALYFAAAGNPLSVRKALTTQVPELGPEARKLLSSLVEQRCAGVPLAHLTGRQQFMGIEMLAGPEALIPRVETELLGYEVLKVAGSLLEDHPSVTLIDVCTGSGNIALGVAFYLPLCKAFGSDISGEAVSLAKKNAEFIGLENKVDFRTGDLFEAFNSEPFSKNVDIVVCNPPYISSQKVFRMAKEISQFEPHVAFDGGPFGFTILSRVIREAPKYLKRNSFLCLEVGLGQGEFVTRMLKNSNLYGDIRPVVNDASEVRVLVARTCGDQ
jgi:release factor glutamine methyltransferase